MIVALVDDVAQDSDDVTKKYDVPYEYAARAFMEILLANSFREYVVQEGSVNCPLCLDDDTLAKDVKNKKWEP